jgi:CopG antitoxin of type II toxin-antitoxin system
MTMTKHSEQLPRPAAELERLAEYYDTHDTSTEMDNGDWVEPQPMATTSLRLPADVIDQLKQQARARHVRYTTYVRSILECAVRGGSPPELAEITERLDRIERALSGGHPHDDQKTALRTSVRARTANRSRSSLSA